MSISKTTCIKLRAKKVGYTEPCFIIAEAGINHNGKLATALKMIDVAADAGADAIKFQTFHAEDVVVRHEKMAAYQKKNTQKTQSQLQLLAQAQLKESFYGPIIKRCNKRKIMFLSTPHGGFASIDFLHTLGVPAFKFGSGDINNIPVLEYAARFKKPMILGTGMSTMAEVADAIARIKKQGNNKIVVLHCTTNYPCPAREVNLRAMQTMVRKLDVLVGYSDHTLGLQASVMAATLGACVIEKHFTLDKSMPGPDHAASLEPSELKELVAGIRDVGVMLGSQDKKPTASELRVKKSIRKSIVAAVDIYKGDIFNKTNIALKRPGTGMAPGMYASLLGMSAKRNIKADSLLTQKDYD